MALAMFDSGVNALLNNTINLASVDVKSVLVDLSQDATLTISNRSVLNDIPLAARIVQSPNMATKTMVNGLFNCDDYSISDAHASGESVDALIYFVDTGNTSTSTLLSMMDQQGDLDPAQVTNGLPIAITVDPTGAFVFSSVNVYPQAKAQIMQANLALGSGNYRYVLIDDADYTPDEANDRFLSDIPLAARVAISNVVAAPAIVGRQVQIAASQFTSASGDEGERLAFYLDTGVAATSPLIARWTANGDGLPFTPSGGNVTINATNLIF